jgi:mannose-6-phosphate isomerase-like protein (cupin superfamily)
MNIIKKPWGQEQILFKEGDIQVKILCINKGESTSLQYHENKTETIIPLDNNSIIKVNYSKVLDKEVVEEEAYLSKGDKYYVPNMLIHRFIAQNGDTRLLEVSNGKDEDIIRLEDKYNRCK